MKHVAVLSFAVALASCGGGSGFAGSEAPAPIPQTWIFGGSSATLVAVIGQTPALVALSPYNNVSATVQLGAVTYGSGQINLSDALNNGDVNPNTLPIDNAAAGRYTLLYVSLYNGGPIPITFGSSTPRIVVTAPPAGIPGYSNCELDTYSNQGSGLTWSSLGVTGSVASNAITFAPTPLPSGKTMTVVPGQQVLAVSCLAAP
jgi:hypothetical protein